MSKIAIGFSSGHVGSTAREGRSGEGFFVRLSTNGQPPAQFPGAEYVEVELPKTITEDDKYLWLGFLTGEQHNSGFRAFFESFVFQYLFAKGQRGEPLNLEEIHKKLKPDEHSGYSSIEGFLERRSRYNCAPLWSTDKIFEMFYQAGVAFRAKYPPLP